MSLVIWNGTVTLTPLSRKLRSAYSLSQLKRSALGTRELVQFFCIHPISEYARPVFHDSLPKYLSNDFERVQKPAMHIIFTFCSYRESLVESGLIKLSDLCQELVDKLFKDVVQKKEEEAPQPSPCSHKLAY